LYFLHYQILTINLYLYIKGIPLLTALHFFSHFILILIFNFIIVLWSLCHFLFFSTIFGIGSGDGFELKERWKSGFELKEKWGSGLVYFQNQLNFINIYFISILFLFLLFCNCFFIYNFFKRTVKYKENSPK